jgi:hypothetical protein
MYGELILLSMSYFNINMLLIKYNKRFINPDSAINSKVKIELKKLNISVELSDTLKFK